VDSDGKIPFMDSGSEAEEDDDREAITRHLKQLELDASQ